MFEGISRKNIIGFVVNDWVSIVVTGISTRFLIGQGSTIVALATHLGTEVSSTVRIFSSTSVLHSTAGSKINVVLQYSTYMFVDSLACDL